jgi:hypothetical protein
MAEIAIRLSADFPISLSRTFVNFVTLQPARVKPRSFARPPRRRVSLRAPPSRDALFIPALPRLPTGKIGGTTIEVLRGRHDEGFQHFTACQTLVPISRVLPSRKLHAEHGTRNARRHGHPACDQGVRTFPTSQNCATQSEQNYADQHQRIVRLQSAPVLLQERRTILRA